MSHAKAVQVSLSLRLKGIVLYTVGICVMWSGASESSGVLLSYLVIPLAWHITTILISDIPSLSNINI